MSANNKKVQIDLWTLAKKISFGISQPIIEIFYGIRKDTITYWPLIGWGLLFDFLLLSQLDQKIFKFLKADWLYPTNPVAYTIYAFTGVTFGFWIWGAIQTQRRSKVLERLTEVFQECGLKSPMGKLPNFIFDKPVDELVRRMRVTNAFMPKAKFEEARDHLESSLQVYIDEISENKSSGTVDILYSHYEISKLVPVDDLNAIGENQFFIGQTRARTIHSDFSENPHLLIGGQTGGGKSTFLRQFITTLYCNNPAYHFTLVDMKGGLEFQIFDQRDRITVISKTPEAKHIFEKLDKTLSDRLEILKANRCKDLDEYSKKPKTERLLPKDIAESKLHFSRHIVVIDEAAELFLGGGKNLIADVQSISRHAARIAAQGRAVGIHLVIATQKPDAKAINGQIKANLTGIISFPMATLGASLSILGNGRAKELPSTPGRAIWKSGLEQYEIQTPYLSPDQAMQHLDKVCPQKESP